MVKTPDNELVGQTFGLLTVVEGPRVYNKQRSRMYHCVCECGNKRLTTKRHLKDATVWHCGCKTVNKHRGEKFRGTPTYNTWACMIQRCTNPKHKNYYLYGGRGITVCSRWLNSFLYFKEDMGERPEEMTLDRVDNNLGYFKENCRWADTATQHSNRRIFETSVA